MFSVLFVFLNVGVAGGEIIRRQGDFALVFDYLLLLTLRLFGAGTQEI
jgi:hypothetical protein